MQFFNYESFELKLITPELLLVKEFKEVFESDKSKNKKIALSIFTYIFLMLDWKSPFIDYDETDRKKESLESSGLKENDLDKLVLINAYNKYQEILESDLTLVVINAMKKSIHKFKDYFKEIDFTEKVNSGARKGSLVYSVSDYMRTMKDADQIFNTIKTLEETLKEKLKKDSNVRGNTQEEGIDY